MVNEAKLHNSISKALEVALGTMKKVLYVYDYEDINAIYDIAYEIQKASGPDGTYAFSELLRVHRLTTVEDVVNKVIGQEFPTIVLDGKVGKYNFAIKALLAQREYECEVITVDYTFSEISKSYKEEIWQYMLEEQVSVFAALKEFNLSPLDEEIHLHVLTEVNELVTQEIEKLVTEASETLDVFPICKYLTHPPVLYPQQDILMAVMHNQFVDEELHIPPGERRDFYELVLKLSNDYISLFHEQEWNYYTTPESKALYFTLAAKQEEMLSKYRKGELS